MSSPVRDRLEKIADEIDALEKTIVSTQLQQASLGKETELADLRRRLNEKRQEQLAYLLTSLSESSERLETATQSLQQTSEAQVRVSESHVRIAESQVKVSETQVKVMESQTKIAESQAIDVERLLRSSRRLERFTIWLLVLTTANIIVVVRNDLPSEIRIVATVLVFVLIALAFLYSELSRRGED